MDKNQLKHIIKEEYHNVKSFMEDKYGFTPELGQVISNPYAKSFVNEVSEPEVISQLRDIVNKKQNKKIKDPKSGKMMRVDMFSASAVTKVYDAINKSNKEKFSKLSLPKMVNVAFTVMKKESVNETIGKPTISKPFKSNDRTFDKVYDTFDKKDYFNSKGLAKVQIGNFERALKKNDKGAQQVLDLFKGDEKKAKDYITQVISDRKKEQAFNDYKALKSAVDSIQKGKPNVGAVDYVKRIIHNNNQKYSIALYSVISGKKFNNYKDIHKDIDSLIGESLNEAFVVAYGKGPKPIKPAFAAYADKKMAQKFMSDLKKDGYKVMMTQKKIKGIDEGKKRFRQQDGIGKSKYTISYHDGKQKHKDGSDFFGIKIFKNKKDLESFRKDLKKQGYIEESVNEGMFKTIDQIRQDSKDARDFIKNVFSDPDFKDMKNDREFLKYLKSIYEGFASDAQRRAAFASGYKAKGKKGKKESIEEYDVENYQDVKEFIEFMREYEKDIYALNPTVNEAEYQGRDVKLGKIMQGDVKKFKVYVKNPKGNVVKVNFGHKGKGGEKTMRIKKSDPARRKAFRSRHNCDNPGPRHKARYWACRTW